MKNELEISLAPKPETARVQSDGNIIDQELSTLETELSFSNRMELVRDLFEEVYSFKASTKRQKELAGMSRRQEAKVSGVLKHYLLPGIPGGEGDDKEIREGYDRRAEYTKTDKHIFINIGQGEMWVVPKETNPYFKISMSECSTIIGENGDNLAVAHISYSALNEIGAVMDFMAKNNITPDKIFAIASVGSFQAKQSERDFHKRATTEEAYLKQGIKPANIKNFEYDPGETISENEKVSHNLTQVLVSKDGFLKWSFDLKRTFGGYSPREDIIGDCKDQEAIEFN